MQAEMTIGQLAKAAGVNVETIRYYQRRGLIAAPRRPLGGHRRYPAALLERLGFIRRAQQFAFSLEEIKLLLRLADDGDFRECRAMAEKKYAVIASRIAELARIRRRLGRIVEQCRTWKGRGASPLVAALRSDD